MKLTGNLKKQVENEGTREGRRNLIEKAGMLLTDEELNMVSGGVVDPEFAMPDPDPGPDPGHAKSVNMFCPRCRMETMHMMYSDGTIICSNCV